MAKVRSFLDHYAPATVRGVLPVHEGWVCLAFDQCGSVVRMRLTVEQLKALQATAALAMAGFAHAVTLPHKPRNAAMVAGGAELVCSMRDEQACTQRSSFSAEKPADPSASSTNISWLSSSSTADSQGVGEVVVLDIPIKGVGR